jgi:hypothetical protein
MLRDMNNFWKAIAAIAIPPYPPRVNEPGKGYRCDPLLKMVYIFDKETWPTPVNDNTPPDKSA